MSDFDDEGDASVITSPETEENVAEKSEELFYCRACGALITTGRERIDVDGGHEHTFVNPSGYIFRIGCFRAAPGCRVAGPPTSEFSWFAGRAWVFAVCASCGAHLGWAYFLDAERDFFGLIMAQLRLSGSGA